MEAKELRIGNLIDRTDYICKVVGINAYHKNKNDIDDIITEPLNYTTEKFVEQIVKPIPLTEEWLEKFGFKRWDNVVVNENEYFERFVLYNVIDGTSNFEVHIIYSNYGSSEHKQIIYSIDSDERMHFISNTEYVHTLQNTFALTGKELELK